MMDMEDKLKALMYVITLNAQFTVKLRIRME